MKVQTTCSMIKHILVDKKVFGKGKENTIKASIERIV